MSITWERRGLVLVGREVEDVRPVAVRSVVGLLACPTCHAHVDELCRTTTGRHREPHASRLVAKRCACGEALEHHKKLCDGCRAAARRENARIGMRNTRARRRAARADEERQAG